MVLLSVTSAAAELGVSPRRVRQNALQWHVGGSACRRCVGARRAFGARGRPDRRPAHRPGAAASAWRSSHWRPARIPAGTAAVRSRARDRYAAGCLSCATNSGSARISAGSTPTRRRSRGIADRPGVVRTAASRAAPEHGLALAGSGPLDAYVRAGELEHLLRQVPMEEGADTFNVCLRSVQDDCWPSRPGSLLRRACGRRRSRRFPNARERRVGGELLGRL